jgi:hypothetical protein
MIMEVVVDDLVVVFRWPYWSLGSGLGWVPSGFQQLVDFRKA